MSAQKNSTPVEVRHLTSEEIAQFTLKFGESARDMSARIKFLDGVVSRGTDVKTIAEDLATAARTDASVPAIKAAMLGYYRLPVTIADLTGETITRWLARDLDGVKAIVTAAKRPAAIGGGIKALSKAIREALATLTDEATPAMRAAVAVEVAESVLSRIVPQKESTPRESGKGGDGDGESDGESTPATSADPVLAAIREAVRLVNQGHPYSADIASAASELTAALSKARKRGADIAAQVLTPAA